MMPITMDVAALAKREHACRIRLVGFMTLVLTLGFTILPTFPSKTSSINSDYRLLGLRDLCERERDECPTDPKKTKPGLCGCGVADTDTDGDGTPDCKDGCPRDADKTMAGLCSCGVPDTDTDGDGTPDCRDDCPRDASKTRSGSCGCGFPDTDADGDGSPDCIDECVDNDPYILSLCEQLPRYECEGCTEKYITVRSECGNQCSSEMQYCINYIYEARIEYSDSLEDYYFKMSSAKFIQSGADSSDSIMESVQECDVGGSCVYYNYLNGALYDIVFTDVGECLVCEDGNEYCIDYESPIPSTSPYYMSVDEGWSLLSVCFEDETATTSEVGINILTYRPVPQQLLAFFNHGA